MSRSSVRFSQVLGPAVQQIRCSRLLVFSVALGALVLAVPGIFSQASTNSLQQGIDTIRQILAKDGLYTRTTTTARNNYKSQTERTYSLSTADGCKLTVQSESRIHTELPEKKSVMDRASTEIFHPDFSDMDPASIYVGDPPEAQSTWQVKGYLVRISVEVGKPLIVASVVDKATSAAHDMPGVPTVSVYVSSRQAADRLAAAFKQVTTACRAAAPARK